MSMKTPFPARIPEGTRRLVEPLLLGGSMYRLVEQEADQILSDEDCVEMYAAPILRKKGLCQVEAPE
jgi:hypothetical protein